LELELGMLPEESKKVPEKGKEGQKQLYDE
jgi:hypothetical protein